MASKANSNPWRVVAIEPLSGPQDAVAQSDQIEFGQWRAKINFDVVEAGKLRRAPGYQKFLTFHGDYNNDDLHDQLNRDFTDGSLIVSKNLQTYFKELDPPNPAADDQTSYPNFNPDFGQFCQWSPGDLPLKRETAEETAKQAITFLFTSVSTSGQRSLVIGTQTRIYNLNEERGNAKLVADGLGGIPKLNCLGPRFTAGQVGDAMVFSNNYDVPFVWFFQQPTFGCAMRAIQPIPDLALIGLTKAAAVFSWKGFIFFGNTEEDLQRFEDRVRWSDENNPLGWDPADEASLTSSFDLGYGEKVMGFAEIGNYLVVLASSSIWIVTVVPPGTPGFPFNFQNVYSGGAQKRTGCLAYPNTLVNCDGVLYYMGHDGVYRWTTNLPRPERVEWMNRASGTADKGIIYEDLSQSACTATVAGYNPDRHEYWISWVPKDGTCPTRCLVFNLLYQSNHLVPYGVTCFGNYISDTRGTIEDFLLRYCGCNPESELETALNDVGMALSVKEGTACETVNHDCSDATRTMPIYSSQALLIPNTDPPVYTENYNAEAADNPSFCTMLGDLTFEDLCGECDTTRLFIFATAIDNCLKQYGGAYSLERFIGSGATRSPIADAVTFCGEIISSYQFQPYQSRLLSGAMGFSIKESEKACRKVTIFYEASPQAVPSLLRVRIGASSQPVDPLDPKCVILWRDLDPFPLSCTYPETASQMQQQGLRPKLQADFPCVIVGAFLYLDVRIEGRGGECSISRISMEVRQLPQP